MFQLNLIIGCDVVRKFIYSTWNLGGVFNVFFCIWQNRMTKSSAMVKNVHRRKKKAQVWSLNFAKSSTAVLHKIFADLFCTPTNFCPEKFQPLVIAVSALWGVGRQWAWRERESCILSYMYHVYIDVLATAIGEELIVSVEPCIANERYTVAVVKSGMVVGH